MGTQIKFKDLTFLFEHNKVKYFYRYRGKKTILFYKQESGISRKVQINMSELLPKIEERENERRRENQLHFREDCRDGTSIV